MEAGEEREVMVNVPYGYPSEQWQEGEGLRAPLSAEETHRSAYGFDYPGENFATRVDQGGERLKVPLNPMRTYRTTYGFEYPDRISTPVVDGGPKNNDDKFVVVESGHEDKTCERGSK